MSEMHTQRLARPGAVITYYVRSAARRSSNRPLLMIGSPMDASGFTALAERFPERTVITYDPRGVGRSPREDGVTAATPDEHAEDVYALIRTVGLGPADIFGSSGGAVNGLVTLTRHREAVGTLVAHEPPLAKVLADRHAVLAVVQDIADTYERSGHGPAMAKFIAFTSFRGAIPPGFLQDAPDPADFGLPSEDDGKRDHPLLGPHMLWLPGYELDFEALHQVSAARIVVAAGAESEGTFPQRAAVAVAERLGTEIVTFPSHHGGFTTQGDPDGFAAVLRRVLARAGLNH